MNVKSIMIEMVDDVQWTKEVVHQAYPLASKTKAEITLVKMVQVQHFSWLGTELGTLDYEDKHLDYYVQSAEDYGVELSFQLFQYYALADAIVDAAIKLKANVAFATLPTNMLTFWRKFQLRNMETKLKQHHCQLYTLEQPVKVLDYAPLMAPQGLKK